MEAAAAAGFSGVGLLHADLAAIERVLPLAHLAHIAEDLGLCHLELECLEDWFTAGERRAASDRVRADLLRAAEVLGARHIKITGDQSGARWPSDSLAEAFAALCQEAAAAGTMVLLEPMPFSSVVDARAAIDLIDTAGEQNGKVLLDVWHVERAGTPFSEIADLRAEAIGHVELDDAAANAIGDLREDTIHNRRPCGEGNLNLTGFLTALAAAGYRGPFGVEIISRQFRRFPLRHAATSAFATTTRAIAASRPGTPA